MRTSNHLDVLDRADQVQYAVEWEHADGYGWFDEVGMCDLAGVREIRQDRMSQDIVDQARAVAALTAQGLY